MLRRRYRTRTRDTLTCTRTMRAGDGNRNRMTSLEVLSNRISDDLLIQTRRSKLSPYPRLSLRPYRCLSHLARHWPAVRPSRGLGAFAGSGPRLTPWRSVVAVKVGFGQDMPVREKAPWWQMATTVQEGLWRGCMFVAGGVTLLVLGGTGRVNLGMLIFGAFFLASALLMSAVVIRRRQRSSPAREDRPGVRASTPPTF